MAPCRGPAPAASRCCAVAGFLVLGATASVFYRCTGHACAALVTVHGPTVTRGPVAQFGPGGLDLAIQHYTKALRGAACAPRPGAESQAFRTLALIHFEAVRQRRARNFDCASRIYRRVFRLAQEGKLATCPEVSRAVAAAHTALNLALTEQARQHFPTARRAFQDGVALVQEFIRRDCHAWVDGNSRVHKQGSPPNQERSLQQAFLWLSTLLTSWALLETKCGRKVAARLLVRRAVSLDQKKEPLLRWRMLCEDMTSQPALCAEAARQGPPRRPCCDTCASLEDSNN
mmetsp:Transcript_1730/g.4881  ORF Transcript_1730/g.4881 Transcript_1730/m.4881 type:complete len:288 (-) Transcript_1730:106-969(-)